MNHRRMIRYRRHRGYGASALSFVTACWNGLWKETLFSVSSVSSVVSLLLCLFFLSSCHYARPNLSSEEMPQKTKDSLNYLYERHYTWNTNLELTADSILLECLPIKDTYINLYRGDRVVVAEFAVHPADSVDSVWVKLAHTQDELRIVFLRPFICLVIRTPPILWLSLHFLSVSICFVPSVGSSCKWCISMILTVFIRYSCVC